MSNHNYRDVIFDFQAAASDLPESYQTILQSHGAWMEALVQRIIRPNTDAQLRFVEVADGKRTPISTYELAWVALMQLRKKTKQEARSKNQTVLPRKTLMVNSRPAAGVPQDWQYNSSEGGCSSWGPGTISGTANRIDQGKGWDD